MPLLTKRRIVTIGIESPRGTAATPETLVHAIDARIDNLSEAIARENPAGGRLVGTYGAAIGRFTGRVEVRGDGHTSGGDLDPGLKALLRCCGFKVDTGTYKPQRLASSQETATVYVYADGVRKALTGAYGTVTLEGQVGQPLYANIELSGAWVTPVAAAVPGALQSTVVPPRLVAASLTLHNYAVKFSRFRLAMGVRLAACEDPSSAGGILYYLATEIVPELGLDVEQTLLADHDWMGRWADQTTGAFTATLGATAGNQLAISCPKVQYVRLAEGDRNGISTYDLSGAPLINVASSIDDDVVLTPA